MHAVPFSALWAGTYVPGIGGKGFAGAADIPVPPEMGADDLP